MISIGEPLIELPEEVVQHLSWDQQDADPMVKAVQSGVLPRELAVVAVLLVRGEGDPCFYYGA